MLAPPDCPHCRALREEIVTLKRALGVRIPLPRAFNLTSTEAKIVRVLMASKFAYVTREQMMDHIYGLDPNPPFDRVLDTMVCKIRRKTEGFGIVIRTRYMQGWFLSAEDRAKIAEMCVTEHGTARSPAGNRD